MNQFTLRLTLRVAVLTLTIVLLGYGVWRESSGWVVWLVVGAGLVAYQTVALYRYVTMSNRKLTRFLESVRYSDFAVSFKSDNHLGESFSELNQQFNEVLEAFRQTRAEKEANLQYLNTVVQHVGVGLLAYDATRQVEVINQAALRLLGIYRLRHLDELESDHPNLLELLQTTPHGTPAVYRTTQEQELTVRTTSVRLRGRQITLVSLQNIRSELQQKEVESWQNLTKVLRHEIMNSLTPVVSLVSTMRHIVETELVDTAASADAVDDLREALGTIEQRGISLMQFVEAYRQYTTIPTPRLEAVAVDGLLANVLQLVLPDATRHRVEVRFPATPTSLYALADGGQVEMVLINLLKNALESVVAVLNPIICLDAQTVDGCVVLTVTDNGPGIAPEALDKVLIPFFTTKKNGSGIGLSISRQIIQLHGGWLHLDSGDWGCRVEVGLKATVPVEKLRMEN
jgi:nitrogen fixation/metabolism regulation signal transduction histidine kinase